MSSPRPDSFESMGTQPQRGIVREFIDFLRTSRKFWMIPLLAVLLLMGALILLSGTAAAPFIYTLF